MTKDQQGILDYLKLIRKVANSNIAPPDGWFYQGPADLLLREGKWYPQGKVKRWRNSVARSCFRNAAMFAMLHRLPYIEGYAHSIISFHHAWCLDHDGRVIELTWDELGAVYFGIEFKPKLVFKGSVLFNPCQTTTIYKRQLKLKGKLNVPNARSHR